MEIQIEENPTEDRCHNEDVEYFVGVVVNPTVQLRFTSDPNFLCVCFKRLDYFTLDLVKDATVVQCGLR